MNPNPNPNPDPDPNPNPNLNPNPNQDGFEEAVKSKVLHPGLHRDRMALINMKELVETSEVLVGGMRDSKAKARGFRGQVLKLDEASLQHAADGHEGNPSRHQTATLTLTPSLTLTLT